MSFPASVEQVVLTRRKPGPSKRLSGNDNDHGEDDAVGIGGLSLDYGRLGGVGLEKKKGKWGWIWASEDQSNVELGSGKEEEIQCFFPSNRLIDSNLALGDISPKEIINSSIRYAQDMCNHYERDGLPQAISDILTEELNTNAKNQPQRQGQEDYDVYQGSKLAIVRNDRARLARNFLAFPTGEVGHHLNIAPFLPANGYKHMPRSRMQFVPSAKPIERFPTEILQIVSSTVVSSSRMDREATALVVRLHSSTHLLNIIPDPSYIPKLSNSPVLSLKAASLSCEDTESRRHVDIAIDPNTWSRILVVDEKGAVWLWWEEKEYIREKLQKIMNLRLVRPPPTTPTPMPTSTDTEREKTKEEDQFNRIAFGTKPGTAILLTNKEVIIIDIDDPSHPCTTLLKLNGHNRYFTGLEKTALERGALLTCLVTTHEVVWIDENKVGPPVISWKHEIRGKDLDVVSFPSSNDQCCIVYSKSRPISMVYHLTKSSLSQSTVSYVKSLHLPYTLSLPNRNEIHESIITLSPLSERHYPSLLTLSPEGEISAIPIYLLNGLGHENQDQLDLELKGRRGPAPIKAYWDDEMVEYVNHQQQSRRKVGASEIGVTVGQGQKQGQEWEEKAKTKCKEINLRWAWEEINVPYESGGGGFYPITFERYLREFDAPLEQLMTGSDLARDSVTDVEAETDEAERCKRSHLLKPLNYLGSTGLPTIQAMDEISFSRHLPLITTLNSDILLPPYLKPQSHSTQLPATSSKSTSIATQEIHEKLQETFVQRKHINSHRDKYNLFQLSLELSLSRNILFSEEVDFKNDSHDRTRTEMESELEPDEIFARAAGKLSINAKEPDLLEFGFLVPRIHHNQNHSRINDDDEEGEGGGEEGTIISNRLKNEKEIEEEGGGLQNLSVRGLMSDWIIGQDPSHFARDWKSWIDISDEDHNTKIDDRSQLNQSQSQRPIKPLPSQSKSHSQSHSQSQIDFTQLTQTQPHYQAPTLLTSSTSLPNLLDIQTRRQNRNQIQRHRQASSQSQSQSHLPIGGMMHRSSPPLMPDSDSMIDIDMGNWANTQVEPGKFGGRLSMNNGEKKKKSKKRIGGF